VTNEPDGSVRAWFEGPTAGVDALCEWCRHGPPGALVDRVTEQDRAPGGLRAFTVR
jgi:acylphosphatase